MSATATGEESIVAQVEEVGGGFIWVRILGRRVKLKAASQDVERAACARLYTVARLIGTKDCVTRIEDAS